MYFIPCSCGTIVERCHKQKVVICYDCKKKRRQVYGRLYSAKIIEKRRALPVALKRRLREIKKKKKQLLLNARQQKIKKEKDRATARLRAQNAFLKRVGGVRMGNAILYPTIYYGKENKNRPQK